ncbi:MAG TPA: Stk1 family PASTA domain-containing Ser/Thr kinase, partial [Jatrophihabitans sp.]|nr:Stk1 family PASTA domain-containing Ser/Thr kinase [Jatrophihabitans sp.]
MRTATPLRRTVRQPPNSDTDRRIASVQTAATDSLVGRSLEGRYRILERIARGGMSTVYAAVDERLDRLVAVKVMSSTLSADPAFSDRFAREARAAARLTHLNVVSVYDQGQESGPDGLHVFLVMELVEGRTLRELLRERGRLAPPQAISIMEPVLSALAAAHRAGLVHRDVKPENILLSDDGVVKVADFGLARAVEADASATRTGLMMGTVAYCAPEQISAGRADPRSDVYAAGVVLFELLTGAPPYKGDSAMNVAYQHVHSRVPAPSSRVKDVPTEIDEVVIAATDSDPTGRPSDAGAFLAEIADIRTALRLPVVPVPPRARPRNRAQRQDAQYQTPQSATTDMIRGRIGANDTTVVPRRMDVNKPQQLPVRSREDNGPPPPVVIPPPKIKKQVSQKTRRRRRAITVVVAVVLLGLLAGYSGWWYASGRYSRVPELTGTPRATAISRLQAAGYKVAVQPGPEFDAKIKKGLVLRTKPAASTRLARGKTVTVVMSAGPHYYTIPRVAKESPGDARRALEATGPLTVASDFKPEASDTVPAGLVKRTDPPAGAKVTSDQTITIYVSSGPPIVDIPSIPQGTPFSQAAHTLRDSTGQFKVDRVDEYSDSVGNGEVISLSPSDTARKGSTITVNVSKGPEMVKVPDIPVGTPIGDATKAITDAGLVPNV